MGIVFTDEQNYQDIADAIRSKNGSSDTYLPSEMANAIMDISGGGGASVPAKDVNFIDYDGTILYSYTVDDFLALSALPGNPTHSGLTSQGWNWTLTDAKARMTAYPEAGLTIGQTYITDDGKTRLYLHFENVEKLSPYLYLCPNGTVVIDWGDGSGTNTLTGTSLTSLKYVQHVYPSKGDYILTITVQNGKFAFYGTSSIPSCLRKGTGSSGNENRAYLNAIRKIELGTGANIGNYAFMNCNSLASVTIPSNVKSIGTYSFQNCSNLSSATIPAGATSLGNSSFAYCYSMTRVALPASLTSVGTYIFQNNWSLLGATIPDNSGSTWTYIFASCYGLEKVVIPAGVTSLGSYVFSACVSVAKLIVPASITTIGSYAFQAMAGLTELHFRSATPPTISSNTAVRNIPSDCKIYVPAGSLSAYTSASNYPSSSTYTYIEE